MTNLRWISWISWIVALAGAPLVFAGCGDSSSNTSATDGGSTSGGESGSTSGGESGSTGETTTTTTAGSATDPTTGSATTAIETTGDETLGTTGGETIGETTGETTSEMTGNASDCGNGILDPGEACDDGNQAPGDGCGPTCAIECGFLCLEAGEPCISGFHAVQCASPGPPFGQPSAIANICQLATLSVDGNHIALSPETTMDGKARHLDAMYTDPSNAIYGFGGDTEDIAAGSQLVEVNPVTGELTPVGPSLGIWVMGAAMNDDGELWVTVFDTYERNETTEVRIARVDPGSGELIGAPTVLTEGGLPVTVWSTHVSDVAFRFDGAMFISANEPGPPPPEPLSRYLEVDRATSSVLSAVDGPDDLYAAGIVFVGEDQLVVAMDIRGDDDIFLIDLSAPPTLNKTLLYLDPIETNSGTADLAGCSKLKPQ